MHNKQWDGSVGGKLLGIASARTKSKTRALEEGANVEKKITTYTFLTQRPEVFGCSYSAFPPTCPCLDRIRLTRRSSIRNGRHDDGHKSCHASCRHACHCRPLDYLALFSVSLTPCTEDRCQFLPSCHSCSQLRLNP
jgi:hypothetical protein